MKGDFSRDTFDRAKGYTRVLKQQGRVDLDADWNEQSAILDLLDRTTRQDILGHCAAPHENSGFKIGTPTVAGGVADFTLSPGRMYVDGILCEIGEMPASPGSPYRYSNQPWLPNPPGLVPPPGGTRTDLVYLDVWDRHVTAIEDPEIREVALGGPDTCTRVQTVFQIRVEQGVAGTTCPTAVIPTSGTTGGLATSVIPGPPDDNICEIPAVGGYRGLENRLYRVEVHTPGAANGGATFKWSRDNGSVVFAVTQLQAATPNRVRVSRLGRDQVLALRRTDWIEVLGDTTELNGGPGTMAQIVDIIEADLELVLDRSVGAHVGEPHLRVRRWDQSGSSVNAAGSIPITTGAGFPLEDGLQVHFGAGDYRSGDYWYFAARTASPTSAPNLEILGDAAAGRFVPPDGIEHHYCRLGLIFWNAATPTAVTDCRCEAATLTEVPRFFYISGDGQEVCPDSDDPQQPFKPLLYRLPRPLIVGRANGQCTPAGEQVEFRVSPGSAGQVAPVGGAPVGPGGKVTVFFDTTGLARCDFYLDGSNFKNGNNFSQQVTAELVDASGTALAPPILFNATLSIAGQVAYDPSACAELSAASPPVTTVQEALDKLCESCHHEPGITIQGISWLDQPVGVDPLFNDSNVSVGRLAAGIRVFCSEAVDPMTISRPTCFVTLELPFPADAALGFQPLVLTAEVGAAGREIFWKPTGAVAARLQSKLFAFRVLSATITSPTTVTIKYSQAVNLARATDSFNYTISGVAVEGVTQVAGDPNSFMVATSLLPGDVPLTLSISNIQATDGSTLSNPVVRIPFFSEDRVLARFTLKGNFIWAASNPDLLLDGEAFGCKQRGVPMDVTQPRDPIVPTSNNSPPPEGVANAIDNTTMTKYLNFERLSTGFTVTPSLGGTLVTGLSLTSANDAPERDPATYRLEGSLDGIAFFEIASGVVPAFPARFFKNYICFPNARAYNAYRLTFPTVVGPGGNSMQISEVELLGVAAEPAQDVTRPGDPITPSDSLPGSESAANAIDNQPTKYLNSGKLNTGFTIDPGARAGLTVVNGLTLTSANDAPERDPASYVLSGSYDGVTFVEISSGNVATFTTRFEKQTILFNNKIPYMQYRLIFPTVANAALANSMQISEVELLGTPAPTDVTVPGDLIVATSLNSPGAEGVANAIDNTPAKYLNFDRLNAGFTVTPGIGDTIVMGLTITSANDAPERDPTSYLLSGSNEGTAYVPISSGQIPPFPSRFFKNYVFFPDNTKSFKSYQLIFPTVAGPGGNSMQVSEVELLGGPPPPYRTDLRLPSGDGCRGGDFEMWFWLVLQRLAITGQPQGATVSAGKPVVFSVSTIGGSAPLEFQWRKNNSDLPGATNAEYRKTAELADAGTYDVVVRSGAESVTSDKVVLIVTFDPIDFPHVTFDDVSGVGDVFRARLEERGINHPALMASMEPETLASILDISPTRARTLIQNARTALRE